MTTSNLRIGVIGVGFGTKVHVPAFQSEGAEVVALCARRRENVERAAGELGIPYVYTDYREMLRQADLDAVSIVTPTAFHHEMVMEALAAGKHVLCEKAFAMDQGQAREMWQRAEQTGLTGMVAHQFRFAPARAYVTGSAASRSWTRSLSRVPAGAGWILHRTDGGDECMYNR